jgi:hypothetical protein
MGVLIRSETFPPGVEPAHIGVYEIAVWRRFDRFAYWNGKQWGMTARTVEEAASNGNHRGHDCYNRVGFDGWRGLAEKP